MAERNAFDKKEQSVRNMLSRNDIEFSVPLKYMGETVGRATVHPDGDITCKFNFTGMGMKLRDLMTEGILDHFYLDNNIQPAQPKGA